MIPKTTEIHRQQRLKALEKLGGKCVRCGFTDYRALQFDHINSGGSVERWRHGRHNVTYEVLKRDIEFLIKKYQILCANCNFIKRYENNEIKGRGKHTFPTAIAAD